MTSEGSGGDGLTRREFLARLAVAGVVLSGGPALFVACSSKSGTGSNTAGTETPSANQALAIGVPQDEYVTSGPNSAIGIYPLNAGIHEPLVRLQPDYTYTPLLATSWEQTAPDHLVFHLRPGVSWHDGTPLTAADVKYTFDRIIQGQSGPPGLDSKATVTAVDPMTVDFKLSQGNLRFIESIVHPYTAIVKVGTTPGPGVPGTGPFKFVEYVRQSHVKVIRNDGYWGTKAKPSMITFTFVPDANSRALALESGQYDLVTELSRPVAKSLAQGKAYRIMAAPPGLYSGLYFNIHGKAPYDLGQDPAIRMAVQLGVDRQGVINNVFGGYASLAQTLVPPQLLGAAASAIQGFNYDPAKAKSVLDAAGWTATGGGTRSKSGRPLKLTLVNGFPDAASNAGVPEFIQANLADIGIAISITTEFDTASYGTAMTNMTGDLWLELGGQNDANPAFNAVGLFDTALGYPGYPQMFGPGKSYDDLVTVALNATSDASAKQATAQAIHEIVDTDMVLVELAAVPHIFGLGSKLRGLVANPSDISQSWAEVFRVS